MTLDSLFNARYREYYNLAKPKRTTEQMRSLPSLPKAPTRYVESAIPLTYNPTVREQCTELYVHKRSTLLSRMLAKSTYYFPS